MALFGGKEIAALRHQLDELRDERDALRRERDAALCRVRELESRLHHAEERVAAQAARLDHRRAGTRAPTVARPPVRPPSWEVTGDDGDSGAIYRGRYTLEGTELHLRALELMFKIIASAGSVGATLWFDVMVDGDGAGQIRVWRDGDELWLSEAETRTWLLGQDPPPGGLEDQICKIDGGVLCVEIA